MNAILLFTIATVVNITLSTIRSLCTIKGGKWVSAITNALCYGFYPLIVMLTAKDTVSIIMNMVITGVANFVCVWIIKFIEEKAKKDKLWLVKMTIPKHNFQRVQNDLDNANIPYSWIDIDKYIIFDTYCNTQQDTTKAVLICKNAQGKVFATENKLSL